MVIGVLMFKVFIIVLVYGFGVLKCVFRDLFEWDFSLNFDEGLGERVRYGGVRIGRKWVILVVL